MASRLAECISKPKPFRIVIYIFIIGNLIHISSAIQQVRNHIGSPLFRRNGQGGARLNLRARVEEQLKRRDRRRVRSTFQGGRDFSAPVSVGVGATRKEEFDQSGFVGTYSQTERVVSLKIALKVGVPPEGRRLTSEHHRYVLS